MEFIKERWFEVKPLELVQAAKPYFEDDEGLKKAFGVELAKVPLNPFAAACKVFKTDTTAALKVSKDWLNDPIVNAAKDLYLKTLDIEAAQLDREQLASKLLKLADEKHPANALIPAHEAKDRIAALKLYAEIKGFTNKDNVPTVTNNTINGLKIVLVKPEKKEELKNVIDNVPNAPAQSGFTVPLKLVKAS
jgi:hypothetical protein